MSFSSWVFCAYAALLLWLGWRGGGARDSDTFFVHNRRAGAGAVAVSMVASCVGGSATLGMTGLAWQVGTPAFWWLGAGALGLVVLAVALARRVRETAAYTLPELVTSCMGPAARPVLAVIVVIAWLAIAGAQFAAMAAIAAPMTGLSHTAALWASAGLVLAYAGAGGQAAVFRSDGAQLAVLLVALLAALWGAVAQHGPGLSGVAAAFAPVRLEAVNADFGVDRLRYFLCIIGGSYVVCPMLFGRVLSARSAACAVRGTWLAALGLALAAALVVAVGLTCRGVVDPLGDPESVLTTALLAHTPPWLGTLVLLGVFSAVVSSADSCCLTAATVLSHDLLRSQSLRCCRLCLAATCLGGVALALSGRGILQLLLMANDVYVCGVVLPVFVSLVLHRWCVFRQGMLLAAMLVGGALGLAAAASGDSAWSFAGLVAGLLLSLLAARPRKSPLGKARGVA